MALHLEIRGVLLIDDVIIVHPIILNIWMHLISLLTSSLVEVSHVFSLPIEVPAWLALTIVHVFAKIAIAVYKLNIVVVDHTLVIIFHFTLTWHQWDKHLLVWVPILDLFVVLINIWCT